MGKPVGKPRRKKGSGISRGGIGSTEACSPAWPLGGGALRAAQAGGISMLVKSALGRSPGSDVPVTM